MLVALFVLVHVHFSLSLLFNFIHVSRDYIVGQFDTSCNMLAIAALVVVFLGFFFLSSNSFIHRPMRESVRKRVWKSELPAGVRRT